MSQLSHVILRNVIEKITFGSRFPLPRLVFSKMGSQNELDRDPISPQISAPRLELGRPGGEEGHPTEAD